MQIPGPSCWRERKRQRLNSPEQREVGILGKFSPIRRLFPLKKRMDVNAKERFPWPFRPILGIGFGSFVPPFIFTCWRCLDKLLRINFPSAFPELPGQLSPHALAGVIWTGHPAPLSPSVSLSPSRRCHMHGEGAEGIALLPQRRAPLPSSIIASRCQNQHNRIGGCSLPARSVPFTLIYPPC